MKEKSHRAPQRSYVSGVGTLPCTKTWRLLSALRDRRQPGKVAHPLRDLLRQRVFGLACGYADCNDAARLADDPIHKLLLDRDPLDGAALGSQLTLSRFKNAVGRADLYRLGTALADAVLGGWLDRAPAGADRAERFRRLLDEPLVPSSLR